MRSLCHLGELQLRDQELVLAETTLSNAILVDPLCHEAWYASPSRRTLLRLLVLVWNLPVACFLPPCCYIALAICLFRAGACLVQCTSNANASIKRAIVCSPRLSLRKERHCCLRRKWSLPCCIRAEVCSSFVVWCHVREIECFSCA